MDDSTSDQHPPGPTLPPAVDEQVRALLAASPASTQPMPEAVEERVLLALHEEARRSRTAATIPEIPRHASAIDHDVPRLLLRQQRGPRQQRPLLAAAAVAAAVAVVAAGGSALHLATRPSGSAVAVVGTSPTGTSPTTSPTTSPSSGSSETVERVHIQLSRTAYDAATLASQARGLLTSPGSPLREGAAEAPSLGPIATEIGVASCLGALGARHSDSVSVDLATYAGEPAAVIVVTVDGASTAYAVRRHCTTGDAQLLVGPTPVP